MKMRPFGRNGPRISAIGLGCMRMSNFAGPKASTVEESVATIRAALDAGVNFLNTGTSTEWDTKNFLWVKLFNAEETKR